MNKYRKIIRGWKVGDLLRVTAYGLDSHEFTLNGKLSDKYSPLKGVDQTKTIVEVDFGMWKAWIDVERIKNLSQEKRNKLKEIMK